MKRLLLFCFLIFSFTQVKAQKHLIKLGDAKFNTLVYNMEVARVIDLRNDRTNIGWIGKGGNQKVHGDLEGNFSEEIQEFFNKNLVSGKNPYRLVIKVNKFNLTERRYSDWEIGTAEVALEFLLEKKDGTGYCKLLNTGSSSEIAAFNDVTTKHAHNLAAVLEDCFKQLSQVHFAEVCNQAPPLAADYLQVNTYYNFEPQSIPILAAAKPKKGYYRSFQEFKRNQPSLDDEEITRKNNGALIYTETGKKVTDIWGYSDGDRAHICYGPEGNFFPLMKQPDHFTFVVRHTIQDNGAVVMGALIGGIAGAAIAGALSEENQMVEFSLNPLTGHKTTINGFGPKADLERAGKIVVYRNAKNEKPEPLSLYVNDSLYAQILPNSFNEFSFKAPVSELNFCLKGTDQSCQKVTPVLDRTSYFECSQPVKANAKLVFKPATQKEADYYLKIIKHNQEQGN